MLKIKKGIIGFLAAAFIFYFVIVFVSDLSKVSTYISLIDLRYYPAIISLVVLNIVLRGLRYSIILEKLDIKIGIKNSVLLFISGLSMRFTPGGIGTLIKSHILKKKVGESYSRTTPSIIYEKWVELLSNVILMGIFLYWLNLIETKILIVVVLAIVVILSVLLKKPEKISVFNKIFGKIKPLKRFSIDTKEFEESSRNLFSRKVIAKTMPLTILAKLSILGAVFLVLQSFGIDLDIFSTGQIYFTSMTAGALTLIPGGLLAVEASLLGLLMQQGIEFSLAITSVIFIRIVTLWFSVLLGFVMLRTILKKEFTAQ